MAETSAADPAARASRLAWWKAIVEADTKGDRGSLGDYSRLWCVFCRRGLEEALRGRAPDLRVMLAWWEVDGEIFASGVYCAGRRHCLTAAEHAGFLLDVHGERATGPNAASEVARIAWTYERWSPDALRRLVLIGRELASIKGIRARGS